jgi:signal recognition particle receptor subunit beta
MKKVSCIDLPGHFNFRARLHESVETAQAIILVLDSKDRNKIPEAAEILYDILNNITVLDRKVPILVVCNKQDLQFAKRATQLELEVERDIEEIRKVRRATIDDQDTAKEQVSKQGYLEQLRKKFTFSDATLKRDLPPITFAEASVQREEIEAVLKFINDQF